MNHIDRSNFEYWLLGYDSNAVLIKIGDLRNSDDDRYLSPETARMWSAWVAATDLANEVKHHKSRTEMRTRVG